MLYHVDKLHAYLQASQAEEAAAEMVGKAVQLSAALEAQGRSRALQEKLRQEQTDAEAQLQVQHRHIFMAAAGKHLLMSSYRPHV